MKKHLPLLFALSMIFFACQKEDFNPNTEKPNFYQLSIEGSSPFTHPTAPIGSSINYQISDNRIVLNDSEDFDIFFWSVLEKDYTQWVNETNFNSMWSALENSDVQEQFDIQKILNQDGIIEVKPWIFKLDFRQEKVFVLPSNHKRALETLQASSPTHPSLQVFNFEDDVWTLLENSSSSKGLRCKEERAKNKYVSTSAQSCTCTLYNWQTTTIAVKYNRFGIWETVKAAYQNNLFDVYGQSNNNYVPAQINSGHFHYHFDERCGTSYYGTLLINPGAYDQKIFTLRSNKKPLERYKSVVNMNVNTSYIVSPSEPAQQLNCILDQF